jgi:hypothetical protein
MQVQMTIVAAVAINAALDRAAEAAGSDGSPIKRID